MHIYFAYFLAMFGVCHSPHRFQCVSGLVVGLFPELGNVAAGVELGAVMGVG